MRQSLSIPSAKSLPRGKSTGRVPNAVKGQPIKVKRSIVLTAAANDLCIRRGGEPDAMKWAARMLSVLADRPDVLAAVERADIESRIV